MVIREGYEFPDVEESAGLVTNPVNPSQIDTLGIGIVGGRASMRPTMGTPGWWRW